MSVNISNITDIIQERTNNDITVIVYPSSYGSPPSYLYGTYQFTISDDRKLTAIKGKNKGEIILNKQAYDEIINALNTIELNNSSLNDGFIFDSWNMEIRYNYKTYNIHCWQDAYTERLTDLITEISPIDVSLYDFS